MGWVSALAGDARRWVRAAARWSVGWPVEPLAGDAVEVRRLDIRTDELPERQFDLVHARLVLEHLTERQRILDRPVAALRPGGWMVIEDYDWTGFGLEDDDPRFEQVADAVIMFMQQAGFEPR
jgi:chemotaxis methyl-accepting protein methylase